MRIIQPMIFLVCAFAVGCAQHSIATQQEGGVTLLDNHGGYSHAGRRIALRSDGSYRDTRYTDIIGDERTTIGHYTLDAEQRHLTLTPKRGEVLHLYGVDYRGQRFWVGADERARITQASESWLRQISLRVVP
jgi:hypothetical protein